MVMGLNANPRPHPGPLPQEREGKARWITIAAVRPGWYVILRNWGCPKGFLVTWQGRVSRFQPYEFLHWEDVIGAVKHRLEIAGLKMVAVASDVTRWMNNITLRVLVKRRQEGKR